MLFKNQLVGLVVVMIVSLSCFAQQTAHDSAEVLFLQARHYSMQDNDSLALKSYEAAYMKDPSFTLKKEVVIQCIKNSQFEKAVTLINNGSEKFNLITDMDQYNYGSKVAEFYCFIEDTATADSLWTKLIYNAVQSHQFDSATVLVNSFKKNIPNSQTPYRVLSWLEKRGLIKSATSR